MAEVDFSNARIEPSNITAFERTLVNPTYFGNVAFNSGRLYDASTSIIGGSGKTQLINEQKQLMFLYQGTFTASGTEFYLVGSDSGNQAGWKVSNISFQSGDTYVFQINASLVCN